MKKRNLIKKLLIILALFIALGTLTEFICGYIDRNKFKPVGRMIKINNLDMHIYADGSGKNTVVFASGWGQPCPYADFYPLHNKISKTARVAVYDRPGYGWSDVTDQPRDIDIIVNEIHELLVKSGEKPPYILVGHSIGSFEVIRYAQLYKNEIKGIILIDGSNPEMYSIIKPISKSAKFRLSAFHKFIKILNITGISRLILSIPGVYSDTIFASKNKLSLISDELKNLDKSMFLKTMNNKNQVEEADKKENNASKVMAGGKLGNIPMTIFTSGEIYQYEEIKKTQDKLKEWSHASKQIIVEGAKHHIHWYNPNIINEEIKKMLCL
ncbi:MAG: alpha/beta hydrolase [Candidatus Wallbacteria bacterium]